MPDDVPVPMADPAPPITTTAASSFAAPLSSLSEADVDSEALNNFLGPTRVTTTRSMYGNGRGNGSGRGKDGTLPHSKTRDEEKYAYIRSIHHSHAALIPIDRVRGPLRAYIHLLTISKQRWSFPDQSAYVFSARGAMLISSQCKSRGGHLTKRRAAGPVKTILDQHTLRRDFPLAPTVCSLPSAILSSAESDRRLDFADLSLQVDVSPSPSLADDGKAPCWYVAGFLDIPSLTVVDSLETHAPSTHTHECICTRRADPIRTRIDCILPLAYTVLLPLLYAP
uniref:Uncharacterized protein n=1 Tax=Mycena chlorophos TaxID=658473 RepID=A0ABQ0LPL9_MYCCL|nr:predicted protein [Mycena chlorophos]